MGNIQEKQGKVSFHPGYYVRELVDARGIPRADFARTLGIGEEELGTIIQGQKDIDEPLARRLSTVSGTSVSYWLRLQRAWDLRADKK